jgi:hypothetical protein
LRSSAPLIPFGIALLHGALNPFGAPQTAHAVTDRAHELAAEAESAVTHHCQDISNTKECHTSFPEGCTDATKPNTYDAYLSLLKNLFPPADALPVGSLSSLHDFQKFDEKSIAMDLGKQKQAPFADQLADIGQGNIYQAIGYLYYAIPGGVETCNCKLKNPDDKDFHIGVGFDVQTAKSIASGDIKNRGSDADPLVQQTSVVVEMTPFFRATFHLDAEEAPVARRPPSQSGRTIDHRQRTQHGGSELRIFRRRRRVLARVGMGTAPSHGFFHLSDKSTLCARFFSVGGTRCLETVTSSHVRSASSRGLEPRRDENPVIWPSEKSARKARCR